MSLFRTECIYIFFCSPFELGANQASLHGLFSLTALNLFCSSLWFDICCREADIKDVCTAKHQLAENTLTSLRKHFSLLSGSIAWKCRLMSQPRLYYNSWTRIAALTGLFMRSIKVTFKSGGSSCECCFSGGSCALHSVTWQFFKLHLQYDTITSDPRGSHTSILRVIVLCFFYVLPWPNFVPQWHWFLWLCQPCSSCSFRAAQFKGKIQSLLQMACTPCCLAK